MFLLPTIDIQYLDVQKNWRDAQAIVERVASSRGSHDTNTRYRNMISLALRTFPQATLQDRTCAQVMATMAIIEGGTRESSLSSVHHNSFGLKGRGDRGDVTIMTQENVRGRHVWMAQKFASYSSDDAAAAEYAQRIRSNFLAMQNARRGNVAGMIGALVASGYATDSASHYVGFAMGILGTLKPTWNEMVGGAPARSFTPQWLVPFGKGM
jgi:flagellum-specific peptidoglycan hydrolase FlgJ